MKIILTTLNSKFTHTSLALRLIGNWLNEKNLPAKWHEYTINTPIYQIIGDLYREKPDLLIFSVYIWNGHETRMIAKELKKLLPDCVIVFGGPEVSFDSINEMHVNTFIDFVALGEGEKVIEDLVLELMKKDSDRRFERIPGITWRNKSEIVMNELQKPLDMDLLAFPYPDISELDHRILYYESSRGCPYNCSYCLSSATKGVRFRSDEKVQADLKRFLDEGVAQVKFIDRTFNADPKRALRIWQWISENDNGVTNFHFEITAELLREEDLVFLKSLRPGLFQFEIGIQTTMEEASEAVNRKLSFEKLKVPVSALLEAKNLHVHLDLIAGLPYESYERFLQSFDEVYQLNPQVLQLGFLKLIKGSKIRSQAELHGYEYESYQPYEVLKTNAISFDELLLLKDIEMCLDHIHNSKRFVLTLNVLSNQFEKPSHFYVGFSTWLRENGFLNDPIKTEGWYDLLFSFVKANLDTDEQYIRKIQLALLIDYMTSLGKVAPSWLSEPLAIDVKTAIFELAKTDALCDDIPQLSEISPKERVKKIRYAGFDEQTTNLLREILPAESIRLGTINTDIGIFVTDLTEKHLVNEHYPHYLFV